MAYEVKDMSGSMFVNNRKEKETHPDFNGSIRIDGKDYWLSGWTKQSANGQWHSLSFKIKDGTPPPERANDGRASTPSKTQTAAIRDFDDDPF
jgi:hypothetical protein